MGAGVGVLGLKAEPLKASFKGVVEYFFPCFLLSCVVFCFVLSCLVLFGRVIFFNLLTPPLSCLFNRPRRVPSSK
jgi:hypothetical protein